MTDAKTTDVLDLAALDAAGFDAFYAQKIEPLLTSFEAPRLRAAATFKRRILIGAPLAALIGLGAFFIFHDVFAAFIAAAIAGVAAYTLAYMPLSRVGAQVKSAFLSMVSQAIGVRYAQDGFAPPAFERIKALDLAPSYDRARFEDLFHGARLGCAFDLYEAHLERETKDKDGDSSWSTVFRGQLIRISFPKPFLGVTIVRRDAGVFNGLRNMGKKFDRIGLAGREFEKIFEVYGTDQIEARALVHPYFMQRLLEIETAYQGKKVRCAFENGDLLVAVEGGDKFEPGDMFKTLADPERARRILRDIAQILKLMDAVLTAESAYLTRPR